MKYKFEDGICCLKQNNYGLSPRYKSESKYELIYHEISNLKSFFGDAWRWQLVAAALALG